MLAIVDNCVLVPESAFIIFAPVFLIHYHYHNHSVYTINLLHPENKQLCSVVICDVLHMYNNIA